MTFAYVMQYPNTSSKVEVKDQFGYPFYMSSKRRQTETISIGEMSKRTGLAITTIRFYEQQHLISSTRNAGGHRRFKRSDIRRLSFVKISQNLGFSLNEIQQVLAGLPQERTPTKRDWEQLSKHFAREIDKRIAGLTSLRETLSGCIGCGCLSLKSCALYNPSDAAATLGPGPRYLIGDSSEDVTGDICKE